jgi:hypothetical protein
MKVTVEQSLHAGTSSKIDLPVSSWEEIDEWYVKWDTLHYHIKGEETWKFRKKTLNSDSLDVIDWKRPAGVEVYPCDEDGETDYSEELASK